VAQENGEIETGKIVAPKRKFISYLRCRQGKFTFLRNDFSRFDFSIFPRHLSGPPTSMYPQGISNNIALESHASGLS
jgi:hypothetical protein